jgi:hypothetical protein
MSGALWTGCAVRLIAMNSRGEGKLQEVVLQWRCDRIGKL